MKFEWEEIYNKDYNITYRAKCPGGWLIKDIHKNVEGNHFHTDIIFIEDQDYAWSIKDNCYLDMKIESLL